MTYDVARRAVEHVTALTSQDVAAIKNDVVVLQNATNAITQQEVLQRDIDLNMHCDKTGRVVRSFAVEDFAQLVQMHDWQKAQEILEMSRTFLVHPLWIDTSPESLRKLAKIDPRGYFVYAASKILGPMSAYLKKNNIEEEHKIARWRFHQEKVSLWKQLDGVSLHTLVECNELMRRWLQMFRTKQLIAKRMLSVDGKLVEIPKKAKPIQFDKLVPDDLFQRVVKFGLTAVNPATFANELKQAMQRIIFECRKKGYIKPNVKPEDIENLCFLFDGYTAFRYQRKTRPANALERVLLEMQEIGAFTFVETITSEKEETIHKLRKRLIQKREKAEKERLNAALTGGQVRFVVKSAGQKSGNNPSCLSKIKLSPNTSLKLKKMHSSK